MDVGILKLNGRLAYIQILGWSANKENGGNYVTQKEKITW